MTATEFERMIAERMQKSKAVLTAKAGEYASGSDRLHNFKVAGNARGKSDVAALDGMLMKHIVSVWDGIDDMEEDPTFCPDQDWVDEKLGDVHNYLYLLEGLIADRRSKMGDLE